MGPGETCIFHFLFVFSFPQGMFLGQWAHWPSILSLYAEIKKDFPSKIMFPTVYKRACPPKSSVSQVNLRAWSKRKMAWPNKFFGAFSAGGPFFAPNPGARFGSRRPCPFQCCLNQMPLDHLNIELEEKRNQQMLNVCFRINF